MNLAPEYLWNLTAREFFALKRQWQANQDRQSWFHASLQATLHNAHFACQCEACRERAKAHENDHHEPFQAADFMPGIKRVERPQQSVEQKKAMLGAMFSAIKAGMQSGKIRTEPRG